MAGRRRRWLLKDQAALEEVVLGELVDLVESDFFSVLVSVFVSDLAAPGDPDDVDDRLSLR